MIPRSILPFELTSDDLVLGIDIGTGTQDLILRVRGMIMENCPKMVLPSPTVLAARKIKQITTRRENLFLDGILMGGGPVAKAVKDHLKTGLAVSATPEAAKTFRDNPAEVEKWGVKIVNTRPENATRMILGDVDPDFISRLFSPLDLPPIGGYAVAVQDHGECLEGSNRLFRFELWEKFLKEGGDLWRWTYTQAPHPFTRMMAVQKAVPRSVVTDTGLAAVMGALYDPEVRRAAPGGVGIVNVGNGHTLGIVLKGDRIRGLFEHHTSRLTAEKLGQLVYRLLSGVITHREVYDDGGHGAAINPDDFPSQIDLVALTGPRWALADGLGYRRVAPFGDMMLAGSYGLIAAWERLMEGKKDPWSSC